MSTPGTPQREEAQPSGASQAPADGLSGGGVLVPAATALGRGLEAPAAILGAAIVAAQAMQHLGRKGAAATMAAIAAAGVFAAFNRR